MTFQDIEQNPYLRQFLRTLFGKIILAALTALSLWLISGTLWAPLSLAVAGVLLLPQKWSGHRTTILGLSSLLYCLYRPAPARFLKDFLNTLEVSGLHYQIWMMGLVVVAWAVVAQWALQKISTGRKIPGVGSYSVMILYFLILALFSLCVPLNTAGGSLSWLIIYAFGEIIFYLLMQISLSKANSLGDPSPVWRPLPAVALFIPFWAKMYFFAPMPKTEFYRNQVSADSADSLAQTQLRGLQLLLLAAVLGVLQKTLYSAFFPFYETHILGIGLIYEIPTIRSALYTLNGGVFLTLPTAWLIVVSDFAMHILEVAIWSHAIIGLCRLCGYNARPNMTNIFRSTNIFDFFSRYNYYFKEFILLSFYYPCFLKLAKVRLNLRIILATFASVGLGNFLSHFFFFRHQIPSLGFMAALQWHLPYLFYCTVLSAGISFSMVHKFKDNENEKKNTSPRMLRVWTLLGILVFYALLRIFDAPNGGDIRQNLHLLINLFGFH